MESCKVLLLPIVHREIDTSVCACVRDSLISNRMINKRNGFELVIQQLIKMFIQSNFITKSLYLSLSFLIFNVVYALENARFKQKIQCNYINAEILQHSR